jgi:hypothetical protein
MKSIDEHQWNSEDIAPPDWQIKCILGLYFLIAAVWMTLALIG